MPRTPQLRRNILPKPPQLAPVDAEWRLFSEPLPNDRAQPAFKGSSFLVFVSVILSFLSLSTDHQRWWHEHTVLWKMILFLISYVFAYLSYCFRSSNKQFDYCWSCYKAISKMLVLQWFTVRAVIQEFKKNGTVVNLPSSDWSIKVSSRAHPHHM